MSDQYVYGTLEVALRAIKDLWTNHIVAEQLVSFPTVQHRNSILTLKKSSLAIVLLCIADLVDKRYSKHSLCARDWQDTFGL